ncbi:MAG: SDR family NAD(P)-dependent oxidoreductase [Clostridia bacterium]|nr:SDR family NAD(P)-dependent oxidoreductase [Clostridia bacterium]
MKTVLVTGGSGFIGSHLCERLLETGHTVINLDNFNDFYDPLIKRRNIANALSYKNYTLIEGDIRDTSLLEQLFKNRPIDVVVHLAALAGVRKSLENPLEYIDVNVKGTTNLLEIVKKNSVDKFVFASSSSVYGINSTPFRESDSLPVQESPYAASKMAGEQFCRAYSHLYGIPIAALRFFTVYGPRQRPEMAIHNFTRLMDEGKEIPVFGDGKSARDYTYISDIIDGIMAAIKLKCSFEAFNLGNSSPVKLSQLINIIEQKSGKMALKRFMPTQKGDVAITWADISKSERMLGYKPKIGIEEGIDRFVKWYNNHKS